MLDPGGQPPLLVSRSKWNQSCIALVSAGSGGFFESIVCYDRNGGLRPGRRPRSGFGGSAPGITLLERRQDHPSRLSGRRGTVPAHRNRRPMRAAGGDAGLFARLTATKDGMPVYVLLCPQLYDRPGNPYGDASGGDWPDNDVRFRRFASAAAQLAAGTLDKNWAADLVHANDWQAALVPGYLAWNSAKGPASLTNPNLPYSGLF